MTADGRVRLLVVAATGAAAVAAFLFAALVRDNLREAPINDFLAQRRPTSARTSAAVTTKNAQLKRSARAAVAAALCG